MITLLFGNQDLELEEEGLKAVASALAESEREEGLFRYDCSDFIKADQRSLTNRIQDFRNAVETVSFFSVKKMVWIKHLEKLPKRRSPLEKIDQELAAIHLFKMPLKEGQGWFEGASLAERPQGHHHMTAKQLLDSIFPIESGKFYLELSPGFKGKNIWLAQGDSAEPIAVEEFLSQRLKSKVVFEAPESLVCEELGDSQGFVKVLLAYLEDPPEGVDFLLSAHIKKEDELPKALLKAIKTSGKVKKLTVSYDDFKPVGWVVGRARDKGLQLDAGTAELLIEIAGAELTNLDHELEKLVLALGRDARPTPQDLIEKVGHSKRFSIFLVGQFLAQRDLKNAVESIESLLSESHAEAVPLFGLIASQFRRLLKVRWLLDADLHEKAIAERLKINPWILKQMIGQARGFDHQELENILIEMSNRDLALKYAGREAMRHLEDLAFWICRGHLAGPRSLSLHWVP
ncbi:MAG: DNA polymerase III subunit delta [bacterium]|nr:DNA polymerase III subunit delta [bacterium]